MLAQGGEVATDEGSEYSTTNTGLDQLVDLIIDDMGLNRRVANEEIVTAAQAADAMNGIIKTAIFETGVANNDALNAADVRDINAYIRANFADQWAEYHGDDEGDSETGFHLVQNDGATTRLFGSYNAVNTVADGIYHLGFAIMDDRLLNEDGNKNASLESVAHWLEVLLQDDLANLHNDAVATYTSGTTNSGLDSLVNIITTDTGLNRKVATSEITTAANAANSMNEIILEAIDATGVRSDGELTAGDIRDVNSYIRDNHLELWAELHGDDEGCDETGFHLVQHDGASSRLFGGYNAVDTVADGVYHLGFAVECNRLQNEDGNSNVSLERVAYWLDEILDGLARDRS